MKWYAVTTEFYDDGRVAVWMTSGICGDVLPENRADSRASKDVYVDYFDNRKDAIAFYDEAKHA